MGGLGDVCLSESVFYTLQIQFDGNLTALGNRRFINLFGEYFTKVEGIESRKWLYLFSEKLGGPVWKRIIFIGKDVHGILRRRWQQFSEEELIFIDMYPDGAFGETLQDVSYRNKDKKGVHIEDYQLLQLEGNGIRPLKKTIDEREAKRVILYPEQGFIKEKWLVANFLELYASLEKRGVDVIVQLPLGSTLQVARKVAYEDLTEVRRFYSTGGVFVSNDSGMAHLAGACGLFTITIFTDFDPSIWHPRGRHCTLAQDRVPITVDVVEQKVLSLLSP